MRARRRVKKSPLSPLTISSSSSSSMEAHNIDSILSKAHPSAFGEGGVDDGRDWRGAVRLRPDHEKRPLWIVPDGSLYLETSHPDFKRVTDFLIAVAEPQSRAEYVHCYKFTRYSLYAAVSVSLTTAAILERLDDWHKGEEIPRNVTEFIRRCTETYGRAKMVLRRNRLFVESADPEVLRALLKHEDIRTARVNASSERSVLEAEAKKAAEEAEAKRRMNGVMGEGESEEVEETRGKRARLDDVGGKEHNADNESFVKTKTKGESLASTRVTLGESVTTGAATSSSSSSAAKTVTVSSFEIDPEKRNKVKETAANALHIPLMEEYEFRADTDSPDLKFSIRPTVRPRDYQSKAIEKMFGNGRARSGVIVLPTGAGKTLTGIMAALKVRKSVMIVCTGQVAAKQWIAQFKLFTTISPSQIVCLTSSIQDPWPSDGSAVLAVTTYTMVGKRTHAAKSQPSIQAIRSREWGLLVLDEVHVAPANTFRMALNVVKAHCKLGLTATLVREDEKIEDLNFLIGPKLYEADWMDLTNRGFLARVYCMEVWCPMAARFMQKYLAELDPRRRGILAVMNPNKFAACKHLIEHHERQGHKILVFSDNVAALKWYANKLQRYYMYGVTGDDERDAVFRRFKRPSWERPTPGKDDGPIQTLLLSRIGDVAIDLPDANVLIQISFHGGSRRQETQRLGRILRPKSSGTAAPGGYNAFFYSLVSNDTLEMPFAHDRKQYLTDQGFTFQIVLPHAIFGGGGEGTALLNSVNEPSLEEQDRLLEGYSPAEEERAVEEVLKPYEEVMGHDARRHIPHHPEPASRVARVGMGR